jgi:Uncharacterized protein conserved in bacteria (DUF2252)
MTTTQAYPDMTGRADESNGAEPVEPPPPEAPRRKERLAAGKELRTTVPREQHAEWTPSPSRRDPIDILEESNQGRLPHLIPIRYGRMLRSPFTFLRGSAGLMASDLATLPSTGLRV